MFGIICAMESEIEPLKKKMRILARHTISRLTFYEGTLGGAEVILVKCGVGKVNAALCAEILCLKFAVDYIINTGVAGTPRIDICQKDIVISTKAMHHDVDLTPLGYARGRLPDFEDAYFAADKKLIRLAEEAARALDDSVQQVFSGPIASGDQFIASAEQTAVILKYAEPLAIEMEGAAIAHVASVNKVPFVIIRSITDSADDKAPEFSYPEFEEIAARHSCKVIERMLEEFSEDERLAEVATRKLEKDNSEKLAEKEKINKGVEKK